MARWEAQPPMAVRSADLLEVRSADLLEVRSVVESVERSVVRSAARRSWQGLERVSSDPTRPAVLETHVGPTAGTGDHVDVQAARHLTRVVAVGIRAVLEAIPALGMVWVGCHESRMGTSSVRSAQHSQPFPQRTWAQLADCSSTSTAKPGCRSATGGSVDHRVDKVEPDLGALPDAGGAHLAAVCFPAAAGRDPPEILDVDVDQLTRPVSLVTDCGRLR